MQPSYGIGNKGSKSGRITVPKHGTEIGITCLPPPVPPGRRPFDQRLLASVGQWQHWRWSIGATSNKKFCSEGGLGLWMQPTHHSRSNACRAVERVETNVSIGWMHEYRTSEWCLTFASRGRLGALGALDLSLLPNETCPPHSEQRDTTTS